MSASGTQSKLLYRDLFDPVLLTLASPNVDDKLLEIAGHLMEIGGAEVGNVTGEQVRSLYYKRSEFYGRKKRFLDFALIEYFQRFQRDHKVSKSFISALRHVKSEAFKVHPDYETLSDDSAGDIDPGSQTAVPQSGIDFAEIYKQKIVGWMDQGDWSSARSISITLGRIAEIARDWRAAETHYELAVKLCGDQFLHDTIIQLSTINDLAWARYNTQNWSRAIVDLESAIVRWRKLGNPDRRQMARAHDYLAIHLRAKAENTKDTAIKMADYERAISLLKRSLKIRRQLDSPLGVAATLHRLGRVCAAICRHDRIGRGARFAKLGEEVFRECIRLRKQHGARYDCCRTMLALGAHLRESRGESSLQQSRDLFLGVIEEAGAKEFVDLKAKALMEVAKCELDPRLVLTGLNRAADCATDPITRAHIQQEIAAVHLEATSPEAKAQVIKSAEAWLTAGNTEQQRRLLDLVSEDPS